VTPLGDVGAVIGATAGRGELNLTNINGPILAPGLGAQGGRPEDLSDLLGGHAGAVLPAYSREILSAGPDRAGLRGAAARARDACARAMSIRG